MNIDAPTTSKDHREKPIFLEAFNAEKLQWASINSKGLLHKDVQEIYRKARGTYEKIILNDPDLIELQDAEYSLWKLHYKHIDEFRKLIRQGDLSNVQTKNGTYIEGFKSFLSEATVFYQDLIKKLRKSSFSVEKKKFYKCQYTCHRFLVCLGDIARYMELCKKPVSQNRDWSVAANYYLESAKTWPDSGNPQNQLALLATYVGDDFLALYHCVRSLAVKEPFPDAWNNLILLFEKNRSSHLRSLSSEASFDFLKPSEKGSSRIKSLSRSGSSNASNLETTENVSSAEADLWPLFVRMISYFFIESSSEDFAFTFASAMREFEDLMAKDNKNLQASLESYEKMSSPRKGPYRALQLVSILIFTVQNLVERPKAENQKEENGLKQSDFTQLAWKITFILMGRFLKRCPKNPPLLASILVFVEWLVEMLENFEKHSFDEEFRRAIAYFFGSFVDFLNCIEIKKDVEFDRMALWEDHELRGFVPISNSHTVLDFNAHRDDTVNLEIGNEIRVRRIFNSAMKIAEKYSRSRKWVLYDKLRRKFYTAQPIELVSKGKFGNKKDYDNDFPGKNEVEEEVILFNPITRHNSVPLYASTSKSGDISPEFTNDQIAPLDELLRRAASLSAPQNRSHVDSPSLKDSTTYPTGPPSLSAWVLDREKLNFDREKGGKNFSKFELNPIQELDTTHSGCLPIGETDNPSPPPPPPHYQAPIPSAPFLPDDVVWFSGNPLFSPQFKANGILGASPFKGYAGLSSSEWLHQYRNNRNLELPNFLPVYPNSTGFVGNFNGQDDSRFDLFDGLGNRLVPSNRMMCLENNGQFYQRSEEQPLLQYLKEREWQLQMESQMRGP